MCPDAKIGTGLLPRHSFSILAHVSFMWAKTPLALTSSLPNDSLASALNQSCGTVVWADVLQDTAGRGETSNAVSMQMTDSEEMCIWDACNILP